MPPVAAPLDSAGRSLVASWTNDPIAIDGRFDEQVWQKAAVADRFVVLGSENSVAPEQTSVRVVTDGRNLFLGFRCNEPEMKSLVASERPRDAQPWLDDSVEVFIDPSNERRQLFQFVANAAGSIFDTSGTISGHVVKSDPKWDAEWRVATSRDKSAWSAEFCIPLSILGVSENLPATLGINLCRNRVQSENPHSSWSPCDASFGELGSLGSLTLPNASGEYLAADITQAPYHLTGQPLSPLEILSLFKSERRIRCAYSLEGRGMSLQSGLTGEFMVPARGRTDIPLPASPLTAGPHRLTACIEDSRTRARICTVSRALEAAPALEIAVQPFSLYERRAEATVHIRVDAPALVGARLAVQLMREGTTVPAYVSERNAPLPRQVPVSFDLKDMPTGRITWKAELRQRDQTTLTAVSSALSYEPNPKVGINPSDRFLQIDGKPFFPIGMYTLQDRKGDHDAVLAEAREAGFNTTVFYAYTTATIQPLLDAAARHDIRAFVYVTDPYRLRTGKSTNREVLEDLQARVKHPALLGWYLVDEPEGIGESDPRTIREFYETVKGADMSHPCSLVVMSPAAAKKYCDFSDIAWIDPYPVPDRPVTYVSECIAGVRKATGNSKPVWAVLQAFDWNVWRNGAIKDEHRPTPAEERCMTYLALVHGAQGIIYWAHTASKYYIRDYPDHWNTMKKMAGELRELAPVLMSEPHKYMLQLSPAKTPIDRGPLYYYGGALYVLAVNRETSPCEVSFSITKTFGAKAAEVMFENRAVPVTGGSWRDTFKPLEVHVYRLTANGLD